VLTLLLVPPDSPMPPRQETVDKDVVRTVVVNGPGHYARLNQPVWYVRSVNLFFAEVWADMASGVSARSTKRQRLGSRTLRHTAMWPCDGHVMVALRRGIDGRPRRASRRPRSRRRSWAD